MNAETLVKPLAAMLVSAFVAISAPLVMVPPAQAVGSGDPVIVSPSSGSTVANKYTGPVTVDFSNASAAAYEVSIDCPDYYWDSWVQYDGSKNVKSWTIPQMSVPESQQCQVVVADSETYGDVGWDSQYFEVQGTPVALKDVALSASTFYPLVRDGYLDTSKISYTLNQAADVVATVRNSSGVAVRRLVLGKQNGTHSWTWDGRRNDGTLVGAGSFKVYISATSAATESVAEASRAVTVATGWQIKTETKSRYGDSPSSRATGGDCYISSNAGELDLDCWGGKHATATWGFALPANAYDVTWRVSGYLPDSDMCCDGKVTKTGTRLSTMKYRVLVKITGWRAYNVYSTNVTYKYKKRI